MTQHFLLTDFQFYWLAGSLWMKSIGDWNPERMTSSSTSGDSGPTFLLKVIFLFFQKMQKNNWKQCFYAILLIVIYNSSLLCLLICLCPYLLTLWSFQIMVWYNSARTVVLMLLNPCGRIIAVLRKQLNAITIHSF